MALTTRMFPANASGGAISGSAGAPNDPNRKVYSAAAGQFIDAAGGLDGEAATLVSQGFLPAMLSGTTALRQSLTPGGFFKAGTLFLDTTLALVLMFDGLSWRNVATAAAVA